MSVTICDGNCDGSLLFVTDEQYSGFCDGWFDNCDGNSVTIMKFATVCDGSVTIPAPNFFFLFSLCCAIKWTGYHTQRHIPISHSPFFSPPTPRPATPTHPRTRVSTQPTSRRPTRTPSFGRRSRSGSRSKTVPVARKSCSCVQGFRHWDPVTGQRAGRGVRVVGEHRRAAKETGAFRGKVIVAIFANCSLAFGWIECGLVKITLILQIQMYVLWHLLAYG